MRTNRREDHDLSGAVPGVVAQTTAHVETSPADAEAVWTARSRSLHGVELETAILGALATKFPQGRKSRKREKRAAHGTAA